LRTNFVSEKPAAWFADRYKQDSLYGGHVIRLGPGNDDEARSALAAFPGGLQIGGGITGQNAREWIEAGASHVIVTSWIFQDGGVEWQRLEALVQAIGKERLVVDLSCRRRGGQLKQPAGLGQIGVEHGRKTPLPSHYGPAARR
jgi:phosphoribosylformimino-5-aminoimidazole carboxamide ribotide isomerase